ncbi:NAD-P-binding protein [Auriscalpium vulgare]|uniref:NAD-P-binding protein n=1 Tax=Auriscalpium vulgare TaxID=40419 RepID=A0ACB8RM76_9AGAM|nr:NAD-P-binding protein [Auriscalpium vulgare]
MLNSNFPISRTIMVASWNNKTTADEVAEYLSSEIKDKNVLVTGVSLGGIGGEAARVVAKYGNLVILGGRNQEKLDETAASIKAEIPTANLRTLILDLTSLPSVEAAAATVNSWTEPIHVLINNAAVPTRKELTLIEGVEVQFRSNFVAPFLFTNLILGRIKAAASADFSPRIVNVGSSAHRFSPVRLEDYNFTDGSYNQFVGYGQSKTADILFSVELAKRLAKYGILSYSVHPGAAWTPGALAMKPELIKLGLIDEDGNALSASVDEFKSLGAAAATHIAAAFDPSIKDQSGSYLFDCQVRKDLVAPHAIDPEISAKLWALAEKLLGKNFE